MNKIIICLFTSISLSLDINAQTPAEAKERSTKPDTTGVDTLKNVTVYRHLPITSILNPYPFKVMPHTRGLSDIIGESANDKIMHPFAIKQRKKERHKKKMKKILLDYDKIQSPNDLLRKALKQEGINPDSLDSVRYSK